jgi:LysM repeat protein
MARKYLVKAGDALSGIAQRFYGDASLSKALANANEIADPNKIKAGQFLTLPDPPGRWYPVTTTSLFELGRPPFPTAIFDLTIPAGMRLVIETVSGAHTARNRVLAAARLSSTTSDHTLGYFPWVQCGPDHDPPEDAGLPQFKERDFGFNHSVHLYVDGPLGFGRDGLTMTPESRFAGIGAYLYGEYTLSGYLELRSDF